MRKFTAKIRKKSRRSANGFRTSSLAHWRDMPEWKLLIESGIRTFCWDEDDQSAKCPLRVEHRERPDPACELADLPTNIALVCIAQRPRRKSSATIDISRDAERVYGEFSRTHVA